MKQINEIILLLIIFIINTYTVQAQEDGNKLKLSGELLTDQRFLIKAPNNWAWNENRLTLNLEKKISGDSKFYTEVWLRNIGLPNINSSSELYNKEDIDPYNLEIREAYIQLFGFLSDNLDVKIGRQRIVWGTADKLNPTANLNPYDLEDLLDFGRQRGSDGISFDYYFNSEFSIQGIFIPIFQPANMPIGIFADALTPSSELPRGMVLKDYSDQINLPKYNLRESSTAGLKLKGFIANFDFSLSYVWGRSGIPISTYNTFTPTFGGATIHSQLSFFRTHIFGADMAGSIGGVGVWAEVAVFLPEKKVMMINNLSALYPTLPSPVIEETTLLKKEIYTKFVLGAEYHFTNGAYLNIQYMHGFMNENGKDALNDYFFTKFERKFLDDKLKITPVNGGFIVTEWDDIENNYAIVYMPEISYMATDNTEMTLSASLFKGTGNSIFSKFNDYSMMMFKIKYSF